MSVTIIPSPSDASHTTVIRRLDGAVLGLRVLYQPFAAFHVHAFPFSIVPEIARSADLQVPGSYILTDDASATAYIGESGNVAGRLPDHLKDAKKQFSRRVFVVTSKDPSFHKKHAEFCQRHLFEAAEAAGIAALVNEVRPHAVDLGHETPHIIRALSGVERPLFDAGCHIFHRSAAPLSATQPRPDPAPRGNGALDEDDDSGEMEIGVSVAPPGVEESELRYGDLWCRGYAHQDRFIVCAGSEVRNFTNESVIDRIKERRIALETQGALSTIEGVTDRKRLKFAVAFPSAAIAAKVVTGAHVDSFKWRPMGHNPPPVL